MLLQMGDVLTSLRMKEGASRVRQSTGGGAFQGDEVAGKIEKYLAPVQIVICQLIQNS